MFVFASYGVQLFGGKLARCNDLTIDKKVRYDTVNTAMRKAWTLNIDWEETKNISKYTGSKQQGICHWASISQIIYQYFSKYIVLYDAVFSKVSSTHPYIF